MGKTKVWKSGGKEDRFIERLISEGTFTKNTKPSSLKKKFPAIFDEFTDNVIRNHTNDIKRRSGLYLLGPGGLSDVEEDDDALQDDVAPKETMPSDVPSTSTSNSFSDVQVSFQNYPAVCQIYKDSDTHMVLVAVNLPGGAQNAKFDVDNDGNSVTVKYNWSPSWYNMDDLFRSDIAAEDITVHHPKVMAMKNGLEKCRSRIDAAPESLITIKLPMKVQTAAGTMKKYGITRNDGLQIVMAELFGFVKDYHKKVADSCVIFNK